MNRENGDSLIDIEAPSGSLHYRNSAHHHTDIAGSMRPPDSTEDRLEILVHKRLEMLPQNPHNPQNSTIFRVPAYFRAAKKTFYEPKMVSIGPYYHGKDNLNSMEEYKWRCLSQFLERNPGIGMDFYLREIRSLEPEARRCYSECIANIQTDQFVLMLLLDGCFILEYFFIKDESGEIGRVLDSKRKSNDIDRIFDSGWGETIKSDLLLLENQIPFFIIHKLLSILLGPIMHSEEECFLVGLLLRLFPYRLQVNSAIPSCNAIHHLLHLLHTSIVPPPPQSSTSRERKLRKITTFKSHILSWLRDKSWRSSQKPQARIIPKTISCASELHEAGVTFFLKRQPKNMFDITFHNGVIEMPLIIINDSSRTIFTNIIAFEQTLPSSFRTFTSFAVLMDLLIDTSADVVLLQRRHILVHTLRNEKEVAFFFNELADYNFLDHGNHYFKTLISHVQKYSNLAWHKYKARLMHDYFRNPWTSISVVAGILLIGLTTVQTYYTVYSVAHS